MWTCPSCGRSFRTEHQQHTCQVITTDSLFVRRPVLLKDLYEQLLTKVRDFGEFRIEAVRPDVIFFKTLGSFLALKVRTNHLDVEFFLDHIEEAPPVFKFMQTSQHRVAHWVSVGKLEDINEQLVEWIRASHQLILGGGVAKEI